MPTESVSGKTSSDIENVDWSTGAVHLPTVLRFGSSSSQTSQNSGDICRICHCESDPQNPLLTPCYCSGSLKYVHQACLQQWLTASESNSCELCKFPFIMHTKIKPFNEWRSLEMSGVERRRLFCAVLFHFAAALCVIWSLCVLIERAAQEVKSGDIGWPFWTKLVVVTVGLTGGVVFMYIQCRQYLHLCNRWRARNRILLIQNAPEKFHPPQSPVMQTRIIQRNSYSSTNGGGSANNSSNIQNLQRSQLHGQIVANIENNPINFERDWTLEDVSQASFKPCAQGSGSLTPFHETLYENSTHINNNNNNVNNNNNNNSDTSSQDSSNDNLFNQISSSSSSIKQSLFSSRSISTPKTKKTNDLSLFKIGSEQLKYPASAVFLENRDILNDSESQNKIQTYPKLYHRHSAIITSPDITENLDKYLGKDIRRYSDTKLLAQNHNFSSPCNLQILNVTNVLGTNILPDSNNLENPDLNHPQITDIIFEREGHQNNFDPLELSIQEILELDLKMDSNMQSPLSVNTNTTINNRANSSNCENSSSTSSILDVTTKNTMKNVFKSLPNLNASSENLLQ